jgi:hypothetical protein
MDICGHPLIAVLSHNATMSAVAARRNTRARQNAQTDANQPSEVKTQEIFPHRKRRKEGHLARERFGGNAYATAAPASPPKAA